MAPQPAQPVTPQNSEPRAEASPRPSPRFIRALEAVVEKCWRNAAVPAEWRLSRDDFQAALERSVAHRFSGNPPGAAAIETYLEKLNHKDLALACACSAGSEAAWEFFVGEYRGELYRAARAITGDSSANDLADSLYADLYGLREFDGHRKSLFDYFHGRSKLGTWLRAVLAQRRVDEIRRTRRSEPLEDETGQEREEIADLGQRQNMAPDPERETQMAIMQAAVTAALDSFAPRDRLRLAYYYSDGRTLAEIGKLIGEHESTVSRQLERTRRDMRKRVEATLRDEKKMDDEQVRLCFEHARGEWPFELALRPSENETKRPRQPGALPVGE